jgi:hypothetical protein
LLGYKRFSIRASNSVLSGTFTWNGNDIPDYENSIQFDSNYTTIELLFDFYYPDDPSTVVYRNGVPIYGLGKTGWARGSYIGLMYNTFEMPMAITASPENKTYELNGVYDTIKFNNYGLTIGIDNLDGWFVWGTKTESKYTRGFSFWLSTYFSFWIGWGNISDSANDTLKILNPSIDTIDPTLIIFGLQYDGIAGLCWLCWIKNVQFGVALGYSISANAYGGGSNIELQESNGKTSNGSISTDFRSIRHGAVLKVGVSF